MDILHEGDVVFHQPTQARCTIISMYDTRATIRTEDSMVMECELHELVTELDTLNVF